ncbi:hypothetical protein [Leucobacter sp. G161]|uniref:hypothetical protein n=1 Tax=Leucobacter sp. G161 TaxID=663704 RepID=UPI00073BE943|nr:hypothetical protein [Leucobacter sp. G161]KUF05527.1 hypothetical protein AUL38_04015 [Leucobacter sp. G161]
MTGEVPSARVTLDAIYSEVQGLRKDVTLLQSDLPHHVTITKDKQEEYETRLANHGTRLGSLELRVTQVEGKVRPRTPWYLVVGAVGGILTSVATLFTLLIIASKVGAALS